MAATRRNAGELVQPSAALCADVTVLLQDRIGNVGLLHDERGYVPAA